MDDCARIPDATRRQLNSGKLRIMDGVPDPGELYVTLHEDHDDRRWLTIERADPVILVSHELLTDLMFRKRQHPSVLSASWVTLAPRATVMWQDPDPTRLDFPVGREPDGTLTALLPDFTGARLTIRAQNMNAVYVVTSYEGRLTWRCTWPD